MGNAAVKEHYQTAQKTGVFTLSNKLTEFPSKLYELKSNLRTLDLSENRLPTVPEEISEFTSLKHLRINRNRLKTLPESAGKLVKLESLHVADNSLISVPSSLALLTHLKQINLSGNELTDFPNVFSELKQLDVLDMSRNKITEIPDYVQNLHVIELILNRNQIVFVSEQISKCKRLRTLRLEENCLSLDAVPRPLLAESNVSVLTLEGNLFEMKALSDLDEYSKYMDRYTAIKKKMF